MPNQQQTHLGYLQGFQDIILSTKSEAEIREIQKSLSSNLHSEFRKSYIATTRWQLEKIRKRSKK